MTDNRPNFLLLGGHKCGSTSLFDYMIQHPAVYPARVKESTYFHDDRLYERGSAFYEGRYFDGAERYAARGEASPVYLAAARRVAPRVAEYWGEEPGQFVTVLRDPVARAWSHYLHRRRVGVETRSFEDAVWEDPGVAQDGTSSYIWAGLYATHLEEWMRWFDKGRFHILLTEDLATDPDATLRSIFESLGLPDAQIDFDRRQNVGGEPRSKLAMRVLRSRLGLRLGRTLIPTHLRRHIGTRIRLMNTRRFASTPTMPTATGDKLRERFAPDVERLSRLLNRDLSSWLPAKSLS